jgi:hypothetical protein
MFTEMDGAGVPRRRAGSYTVIFQAREHMWQGFGSGGSRGRRTARELYRDAVARDTP